MAKPSPKSKAKKKKDVKALKDREATEYEDSPVRILRQTREQTILNVETFPVPDTQPLPST